jgi:predicted oxidoreductase
MAIRRNYWGDGSKEQASVMKCVEIFWMAQVEDWTKCRQIFLATKFGNHVTPDGGREIRNDSEYIHKAVAESLRRLQTNYIDLLYWFVIIKHENIDIVESY